MNLIFEQVRHCKFGVGLIIDQTSGSITVEFGVEYGIKNFSYPFSFESLLELHNPVLKQKVTEELREIREQEEAEREEENKRRDEEKWHLMLEKKRAATQKRPSTKRASRKSGRHSFD